ncbi:amino acid ABC transporter permease [Pantoea cypripedii]|uniref:Glutamate ABC transporter permease n=1 Tax=Pantoea cypripedii TaxID=55209 RepID=A0A1X1ELV0_PANCY|nr:amino acid ABC transporter permease [Pantoea cypripedii]MBP2199930.1 glutamate/aspartate transport system permease protein [Pantoea cypripedii]ORM89879.1 glutamate ABC transporter permease [Pantoea cypripedii]
MNYHWNWAAFFDVSLDGAHTYWETLVMGLGWTAATAIGAFAIALLLGSLAGVLRNVPSPWLNRGGSAFVEVFRNIPLLMQMFLWYFVLPEALPKQAGDWLKQLPDAQFYTAVLCLGCYHGARMAEVLRAGLESLSKGQRMAGQALGLTLPQTYLYVLLPVAYRIVTPAITSEFLSCTKNTSVALAIGLIELTGSARAMQENTFQVFEAFSVATLLYLLLNMTIVFTMRGIEKRAALPGYGKKG